MIGIVQSAGSSPTRHLVFACFFYLIGVVFIVARIRQGEITWKRGGKMSHLSQVAFILMSLSWGSLSLASALEHGIPENYDMAIRFGTIGFGLACSVYDRYVHPPPK